MGKKGLAIVGFILLIVSVCSFVMTFINLSISMDMAFFISNIIVSSGLLLTSFTILKSNIEIVSRIWTWIISRWSEMAFLLTCDAENISADHKEIMEKLEFKDYKTIKNYWSGHIHTLIILCEEGIQYRLDTEVLGNNITIRTEQSDTTVRKLSKHIRKIEKVLDYILLELKVDKRVFKARASFIKNNPYLHHYVQNNLKNSHSIIVSINDDIKVYKKYIEFKTDQLPNIISEISEKMLL